MEYKYGMRVRGFAPLCQPMDGFVRREDDNSGKYYDILVYNRPLSGKEIRNYQLDYYPFNKAIRLITDFCLNEYGSEPDFSDPSNIGIAYTQLENEVDETDTREHDIQATIDLINFEYRIAIDDVVIVKGKYNTLEQLINVELEYLDFCDLVTPSTEDWITFNNANKDN